MSSIAELIADYQAKRLTLPGLFEALAARGALPDETYGEEQALLEAMAADGRIEPTLARALAAKLRSLQPSASATPVAAPPAATDDDVTKVQVSGRAAPPPTDGEMTMVQPASRPPASSGDADATVVAPASRPLAADAPPLTAVTGTQGTASSSSFNRSSWEKVAEAAGGDYATVGMLLKGRFLLEREIGRGGMGVVYLARDERKVEARDRDPYVAVKVLNDEFRRHPDSLIALQRESRRAQLLAHDNIVRVYDFDKDRTIVFMTMEYIDGTDLRTLIRERAYHGMPLADARPLIEGMGWALKRAHAAGIVHSDFKPGNVMVTREGVPKVFDFGIARAGKHMSEATGEETVFDAGTLGALTPAYASLEMIQGKEPSPSDDIYALGCVTFELLTGKHPFDKQSAEVAMKEGRKPPPVPGLTRRQYKTLCNSIAFHAEQRLQSAGELIDGLRDIGLRERLVPWLGYGAVAAVLVAGGTWGTLSYLHQHHLKQVVARFAAANPHRYANENEAMKALDGLDEDDRKRLVLDQGEAIQGFLLARIDTYWNPSAGRYDFPGAQHVFDLRDQLKLYSPKLDARRTEVTQQKNDLLNTLDTELSQRIAAGAIFEDQPSNAVATLDRIRAIDPRSALLHNAELELKYDIAIGQSLSADHADEARQRLALATRLFPDSARLKQRAAQLAALAAPASAAPAAGAPVQSIAQARTALAALVASPSANAAWQQSVANAMAVLHNDPSPETRRLVAALGTAIAGAAGQQTDPMHLPQDLALVNFGLQYAPQSAPLLAQRDKLATLQSQAQAQLDQEAVAAEVATRIESVRRATAAGDSAKALESLARIRSLQPDNPFLAKEGPQLVASAYLGQADDQFQRGKYQAAANVLAQGLSALGNRSDLRNAQLRYELVAALFKTNGKPMAEADYQRARTQLGAARKADAQGLDDVESALKQHGHLPQGSLAALLDSLKPSAATAPAAPTPAAPAPGNVPSAPGAAAPGHAPTEAATPTKPASGGAAKPATETAGTAAPTAGAAAAGNDPCARPDLAGKGRACSDTLGANGRGPALVVIPGIGGGKAYAMSRTEVTVGEFNRYCRASHACAGVSAGDRDASQLPVSNISLAQARGYVQWLSSASGYTYRLPSDAEWMHAAHAGGSWKQSPDSNCIPPASNDDGSGGPISALGREPNPWGLVNMTGNVWEWVTSGGGVIVRGGSYNSYWSDCTVDSQRSDSGNAQKDVGFRVLRELK